jgi:hypothetical protein
MTSAGSSTRYRTGETHFVAALLVRHVQPPSAITGLLNDIRGDVISYLPAFSSSIPFSRVVTLLQQHHSLEGEKRTQEGR